MIQNNRGVLALLTRNIGDYSRDELIDALLSSMEAVWWDREEAIRAATRHLGSRRTGSLIRDAFKSAINGRHPPRPSRNDRTMIRKARKSD